MKAAHNLKKLNMGDPKLFILDDYVATFFWRILNNAVDSK